MMGLNSRESSTAFLHSSIDPSLVRPPELDIPIDQLMIAVESVRPYVRARLLRIGRVDDLDDVMQEVRVAAWDGLVKRRYRQLPDASFGGWVQGIAVHLCADHVRRTLAHPWMSLTADPEVSQASPVDFATTESVEQIAEREWVAEVLTEVRQHVPAETWERAVKCLTTPRQRHEAHTPEWEERKRWHAVTVVRQTAVTVKAALEVDARTLDDSPTIIATAVCCIPTVLLQVVAERLVLTGIRGAERTAGIADLSAETGVSKKYLEGRIGYARNLYLAALDVLERAVAARQRSEAAFNDANDFTHDVRVVMS
ncbi:sigma factor [Paenarthrobacter sp. PH39-S1]|uniref:RNA polymerase sigma factor n=1 Tax=Paenarthrobacter sp. PH39-S1 TaxID=3046204 RepID=UPI0024BBC4EA|nr:sigma factor [Paenarthrobacter sp. PH39-S1]MDJ0356346.1 sigma factor [Paenarthrobacter sp. PH39-S1]